MLLWVRKKGNLSWKDMVQTLQISFGNQQKFWKGLR